MTPLGPWPAAGAVLPIAVAVSGGADSTALALLASRWARERELSLLAFVVDHGVRPASAGEAADTMRRLHGLGIAARLLVLDGLGHGPGLAERARIARYDLLTRACMEAGAIDLLLGHHAGDQAETVLMRRRAGSGPDGLAGMAALVHLDGIRLLRPLLPVAPSRLRGTLVQAGVGWIEDPSNRDPAAQRTRLRTELATGNNGLARALLHDASVNGAGRAIRQQEDARSLAASALLRPEGFALLPPALLPAGALGALIRTIGGASYAPAAGAVARLLARPHPVTLAGTRLLPAGRFGPGWLLVREAAAVGPDCDAVDGVVWDRRFRLDAGPAGDAVADGLRIGALGPVPPPGAASRILPAAVRSTLPALRRGGVLVAVPHLGWAADGAPAGWRFRFTPTMPASASACFADH